jgi:hypothetical protein
LTSATVTGHGGAGDDVWQTPASEVRVRAGANGEARDEATGHRGARAHAGVATMPVVACLGDVGTSWAGQCRALLGQGSVPACSVC